MNRRAPIVLSHQIDVFAPPEKVWERLARVEFWPIWHPDIGSAYWTDDKEMDRRGFKFRVKLFRFKSRLKVYDEPRLIGWEGRTWFSRSRQVFRLDGDYRTTIVTSEISYEGVPVSLFSSLLREPLDRLGQTWLAALKTNIESEREAGVRSPGTSRPR